MEEGKVCDSDYFLNLNGVWAIKIFGPIFERLPFTPNQITVFDFFTSGLLSTYFFAKGTYKDNLIALFFCVVSAVSDRLDGFIARKRGVSSRLGGWLDSTFDLVAQNLIVAAVVFGVFTAKGNSSLWLAIGLFAIVSMAMSNTFRNLHRDNFGLGFHGDVAGFRKAIKSNKEAGILDKLFLQIIAPTNFFFIFIFTIRYFLILGALFNKMDVFLVATAASCFVRVMTLFYVYALFLADEEKKSNRLIIKILHSRYQPI